MVAEDLPTYTQHAQQLSLFERATHEPDDGREVFRDPAFRDNKSLPIHRWVPWIAGYSAPFVDDVLSAYVPAGKTALVLDPFQHRDAIARELGAVHPARRASERRATVC